MQFILHNKGVVIVLNLYIVKLYYIIFLLYYITIFPTIFKKVSQWQDLYVSWIFLPLSTSFFLELAVFRCPQMAWVYQYYICLDCTFKDKLCSLFLLPVHFSLRYIHARVRLWQMLCLVSICVLTLDSLPVYPLNHFPSLHIFLLFTPPSSFLSSHSLHPLVPPCINLSRLHISFPPTFYPSPASASLHTFLHYMSPTPPMPRSSCLPSVHSVICTVTDAVLAPSLSTVSPLCLQNSII